MVSPEPAAASSVLPEHVRQNRNFWDSLSAEAGGFGDQLRHGRVRWACREPVWGDWAIPESQLGVLPSPLTGWDTLELGCGTGYLSGWLARLGARPVGLDVSARQLALARRLQHEFGQTFPLIRANAEEVPLREASFDLVISEYGAPLECDPHRWLPEAARLLRNGGQLIFLSSTPIGYLCTPDDEPTAGTTLVRDYFGMGARTVTATNTTEFQLPYGDWVRLFRRHGLRIEDLLEIRAPEDGHSDWPFFSSHWARRWPSEHVWKVSKESSRPS